MFITKAQTTDLLHLGVRDWEAQRAGSIPVPSGDECILVWKGTATRMPDAIVVTDGGAQGFLAWTTTYLPHLTPITALVELVEYGRRATISDQPVRSPEKANDESVIRGCLGLLHAEVAGAFQGAYAPVQVGLTPYVSTFSWLALQLILARSEDSDLGTARKGWEEARRLLDAKRLQYDAADVEDVWWLATGRGLKGASKAERYPEEIAEFLNSVEKGRPSFDAVYPAGEHADLLGRLGTGTLESRVDAFRVLTQALYERRRPSSVEALVLGFALSLISQGSFSHVALLGPSRVADIRPLLWYGWFDFYRHSPEAAGPAAAAASLRLLGALRADCSGWLRRDIAIEELRVLSRQKAPFSECLLDTRHPVGVEIVTGAVSMIQPGQISRSDTRGRHGQRSLFEDPM